MISHPIPWLLSLTFLTACSPDTNDAPTDGTGETTTGATTEPTTGPTTGIPTGSASSGAKETDPGDTQTGETDTDAPVCGAPTLEQVIATGKAKAGTGNAVAGAGDVNGDGVPDVVIGAPGGPEAGDPNEPGRAFVVFGPAQQAELVLGETEGLTLVGETARQTAGEVVAGLGDVNGDGLSDIAVAAGKACFTVDPECLEGDCETVCSAGPYRGYVVFGRALTGEIALAEVAAGEGGFMVTHADPAVLYSLLFAPLGDLDGDGRADFAIAAPYAADFAGEVYVVFGKPDGAPVDLAAVADGTGGYVIRGESSHDGAGTALRAAGDVDGDGRTDLVIGAPQADDNKGRAYVVFGKASGDPVLLSAISAGMGGGFALVGEDNFEVPAGGLTGLTVAPAGDIDGDGLADVAVGAPLLRRGEGVTAGRAYIVLGKADAAPVQLAGLTAGVVIDGANEVGFWLDGDGSDLDGDGDVDLVVGNASAAMTLVSGAVPGTTVHLGDAQAPSIDFGDGFLRAIVGDLDCDGRSDLALGSTSFPEEIGQVRLLLDFMP